MKRRVEFKKLNDILAARLASREVAAQSGFGSADQTRLATAVSEIARNAIQYAGGGVCLFESKRKRDENIVRVVIQDCGPGINDVEKALTPGFSTSGRMGRGLSIAKCLVHRFEVQSRPGSTTITMEMTTRKM
ncbi:MAG: ATP-binding protein [Candidatus Zixiibacteriota bacterium]